jgi:hypothetical protein
VYAQRPACTKEEDPKTFEFNAKNFGTTEYKKDRWSKSETYALTKPLLVYGIHQLDTADVRGLPGADQFQFYSRLGDW